MRHTLSSHIFFVYKASLFTNSKNIRIFKKCLEFLKNVHLKKAMFKNTKKYLLLKKSELKNMLSFSSLFTNSKNVREFKIFFTVLKMFKKFISYSRLTYNVHNFEKVFKMCSQFCIQCPVTPPPLVL